MIDGEILTQSGEFLFSNQNGKSGLIHAFDSNGSHRASVDFATGFAGTILVELEDPAISTERLRAMGISLISRQNQEGGWSYNNDTFAADSDSTSWVLSFISQLAEIGQIDVAEIAPILIRGVSFLLNHQDSSGGFITFIDRNLRESDLLAQHPERTSLDLSGWCGPNPECTAAACLALLKVRKLGLDIPDDVLTRADNYLISQIRLDGSVDSYWYTDDIYATALTAEYLLKRGRGSEAANSLNWLESRLPDLTDNPLYLSIACRALLQYRRGSQVLKQGIENLLRSRKGDHWETGEAFWTFPAFNYHSGSNTGKGIFRYKDDPQNVFVTSFAMSALKEALDSIVK